MTKLTKKQECITEVVNQANNGNRIQLTFIGDKVLMQIGSVIYEFKLSYLERKISKHKANLPLY